MAAVLNSASLPESVTSDAGLVTSLPEDAEFITDIIRVCYTMKRIVRAEEEVTQSMPIIHKHIIAGNYNKTIGTVNRSLQSFFISLSIAAMVVFVVGIVVCAPQFVKKYAGPLKRRQKKKESSSEIQWDRDYRMDRYLPRRSKIMRQSDFSFRQNRHKSVRDKLREMLTCCRKKSPGNADRIEEGISECPSYSAGILISNLHTHKDPWMREDGISVSSMTPQPSLRKFPRRKSVQIEEDVSVFSPNSVGILISNLHTYKDPWARENDGISMISSATQESSFRKTPDRGKSRKITFSPSTEGAGSESEVVITKPLTLQSVVTIESCQRGNEEEGNCDEIEMCQQGHWKEGDDCDQRGMCKQGHEECDNCDEMSVDQKSLDEQEEYGDNCNEISVDQTTMDENAQGDVLGELQTVIIDRNYPDEAIDPNCEQVQNSGQSFDNEPHYEQNCEQDQIYEQNCKQEQNCNQDYEQDPNYEQNCEQGKNCEQNCKVDPKYEQENPNYEQNCEQGKNCEQNYEQDPNYEQNCEPDPNYEQNCEHDQSKHNKHDSAETSLKTKYQNTVPQTINSTCTPQLYTFKDDTETDDPTPENRPDTVARKPYKRNTIYCVTPRDFQMVNRGRTQLHHLIQHRDIERKRKRLQRQENVDNGGGYDLEEARQRGIEQHNNDAQQQQQQQMQQQQHHHHTHSNTYQGQYSHETEQDHNITAQKRSQSSVDKEQSCNESEHRDVHNSNIEEDLIKTQRHPRDIHYNRNNARPYQINSEQERNSLMTLKKQQQQQHRHHHPEEQQQHQQRQRTQGVQQQQQQQQRSSPTEQQRQAQEQQQHQQRQSNHQLHHQQRHSPKLIQQNQDLSNSNNPPSTNTHGQRDHSPHRPKSKRRRLKRRLNQNQSRSGKDTELRPSLATARCSCRTKYKSRGKDCTRLTFGSSQSSFSEVPSEVTSEQTSGICLSVSMEDSFDDGLQKLDDIKLQPPKPLKPDHIAMYYYISGGKPKTKSITTVETSLSTEPDVTTEKPNLPLPLPTPLRTNESDEHTRYYYASRCKQNHVGSSPSVDRYSSEAKNKQKDLVCDNLVDKENNALTKSADSYSTTSEYFQPPNKPEVERRDSVFTIEDELVTPSYPNLLHGTSNSTIPLDTLQHHCLNISCDCDTSVL